MATPDDSTDTQTQAPPAATSPDILTQLGPLLQQFMPQPVQQNTTPVSRSWTSLLGQALAGGPPVAGMSDADKEVAGHHALMDFGTGLMAASRYQPGQTLFSNLAGGFQGAKQGEIGAEEMAMSRLGAQQEYAQQQAQNKLEALKTALPFLRMEQAAGVPNLLAGGGGAPPAPNVAQGGSIADPLAGLPKDKALAGVVQRESGGQNIPTAILGPDGKPASTATGYYQMLDSTWQEAAALAGIKNPPARAMDASKAQQDAAASALYDKYKLMPWAKSAPVAPTTTAAAPSGTPAPYKVASTGAIPPPPSSGPTAPATGTPAADDTFFPTPNVSTSPTLRGPGSPVPPAPSPTTTVAANAPAPQATTQADQPPAPAGPMTIEQYRALHPSNIDPSTFTVTPDSKALAQAEAERQTAAQNLQAARLAGDNAAANKALNAATEASSKIATLQQQAQVETAKMRLEAQNKAEALTQQGYNDEMTRQQQAQLKAQELAQTAAQAELERQNKIDLAKLGAGQTWHQKLQEQSAQNAQENTLKPMAEQAAKAHNMNLSLAQLQPLLQDLPPGGGALGTVLNDHPELAPLFNSAGILNDKSADAVRLVNGLVANISTQMKPTGLGALREYEWDAFKSQLPSMLSTPAGQQKAIALLMNMNNRIGSEASWMNNYFSRKVPDDMSDKPGAMMPAHNLESDDPKESVQQRMDRELGPIVPAYTVPKGQPVTGSGQAAWEASLPPGKPFYRTYSNGTKSLEVKPWQ